MTDEQIALSAKELQTNEAFKNAIETAKRQLIAASLNCDAKDDLGRFRYLTALKVVEFIPKHITALLQSLPGEPEPDVDAIYNQRAQGKLQAFLSTLAN